MAVEVVLNCSLTEAVRVSSLVLLSKSSVAVRLIFGCLRTIHVVCCIKAFWYFIVVRLCAACIEHIWNFTVQTGVAKCDKYCELLEHRHVLTRVRKHRESSTGVINIFDQTHTFKDMRNEAGDIEASRTGIGNTFAKFYEDLCSRRSGERKYEKDNEGRLGGHT